MSACVFVEYLSFVGAVVPFTAFWFLLSPVCLLFFSLLASFLLFLAGDVEFFSCIYDLYMCSLAFVSGSPGVVHRTFIPRPSEMVTWPRKGDQEFERGGCGVLLVPMDEQRGRVPELLRRVVIADLLSPLHALTPTPRSSSC
jgi:hypothetical protein